MTRTILLLTLLILATPAAAQPYTTDGGVTIFPAPDGSDVAIGPDDADSVQDYAGQAGASAHIRMSRGPCDPYASPLADACDHSNPWAHDATFAWYRWGLATSYPGIWELNLSALSIHSNHAACFPQFSCNGAGQLLVGDQWDAGGWYFTSLWNGPPFVDRGYVVMAADRWDHTSHGDIRMQVRDPADGFLFQSGQYGSEQTVASISAAGALMCSSVAASWIDLESPAGPVRVEPAADGMSLHVQLVDGSWWGVPLIPLP